MARKTQKRPRNSVKREDFKERRSHSRLSLPLEIRYTRPDAIRSKSGTTKNISVCGCLLSVREEMPLNSPIAVALDLGKAGDKVLRLEGKVKRFNGKHKGAYEYGIAFNELNKKFVKLFSDFCFARMFKATGFSA